MQPIFAKEMYHGKKYLIDPQLPVMEEKTRALLKDGYRVLYESSDGSKFNFVPDSADIGKRLTLERFVGNKPALSQVQITSTKLRFSKLPMSCDTITPNSLGVRWHYLLHSRL